MDILFQQQIESVLLSEVEDVIKEEIRDISTELFMLEAATENLMNKSCLKRLHAWKKKLCRKNGKWLLLIMQRVNVISLVKLLT